MKHLNLLVWITQLGLSVAIPLGGFVFVALWLQKKFQLGTWVLIVGIILGILGAADGLRTSLKAMEIMAKDRKEDKPPVSFNDHD